MNVLEIGGGPNAHPNSWVQDIRYGRAPVGSDDETPWHWTWKIEAGIPVDKEFFDVVKASHVLEHTPTECRINIFNEVQRVLKPGGFFDIKVPQFPHDDAIADPTHLSYFVPASIENYFTSTFWNPAEYGAKCWDRPDFTQCMEYDGRHEWLNFDGQEIRALLQKPTETDTILA